MTLAELVVASAMGIMVLGVIVMALIQFRRQAESPAAIMSMEQSTFYFMRLLQRDLSETNLQSVRSLPGGTGVVMASPRDLADSLQLNALGLVDWKKFIYYRVAEVTSKVPLPTTVKLGNASVRPGTGELSYDEDYSDSRIGAEPRGPGSSPVLKPGKHRVLAHNMLIDKSNENAGLSVYYVDRLSNAERPFTDTQQGEPVCVAINLMDVSSSTGKPTIRRLLMQVKPKN